jgi:hypothetical protein
VPVNQLRRVDGKYMYYTFTLYKSHTIYLHQHPQDDSRSCKYSMGSHFHYASSPNPPSPPFTHTTSPSASSERVAECGICRELVGSSIHCEFRNHVVHPRGVRRGHANVIVTRPPCIQDLEERAHTRSLSQSSCTNMHVQAHLRSTIRLIRPCDNGASL